jgi:hypothetical protein
MSSIHLPVSAPASLAPSTPSPVSVPDNSPSGPLTPQLALQTMLMEEDDDDDLIDYNRPVPIENPYEKPEGFIFNNEDSRLFYPLYVKDSHYNHTEGGPRLMIAPFIKYSPDFTKVTGTEGRGFEQRTTDVQIGRRNPAYTMMSTDMWRTLQKGEHEFVVNEALSEMGDLRLTGEVNRYRGLTGISRTLNNLRQESMHQVNDITKELVAVDNNLTNCKRRLEHSDAYMQITKRIHQSYPSPVPPRHSPEPTPFSPRRNSPVEMPMLADTDRVNRNLLPRCYRCHSTTHKVQKCPQKGKQHCTYCGKEGHKANKCNYKKAIRTIPLPDTSSAFATASARPRMTLLERIHLLDKENFVPTACAFCAMINPDHEAKECHMYEKCDSCKATGPYRFKQNHTCYFMQRAEEVMLTDADTVDWDLYWGDDNHGDF